MRAARGAARPWFARGWPADGAPFCEHTVSRKVRLLVARRQAKTSRPYYLAEPIPRHVELDIVNTEFSPGVRRMQALVGQEAPPARRPGGDYQDPHRVRQQIGRHSDRRSLSCPLPREISTCRPELAPPPRAAGDARRAGGGASMVRAGLAGGWRTILRTHRIQESRRQNRFAWMAFTHWTASNPNPISTSSPSLPSPPDPAGASRKSAIKLMRASQSGPSESEGSEPS
jgi:hypothetical protein